MFRFDLPIRPFKMSFNDNPNSNYIQKRCQDCSQNFCHLCASIIYQSVLPKCKFTSKHHDRYVEVFGFHPRFLNEEFTGRFYLIDNLKSGLFFKLNLVNSIHSLSSSNVQFLSPTMFNMIFD